VDRAQAGVEGSIDRNVPATAEAIAAYLQEVRELEASRL